MSRRDVLAWLGLLVVPVLGGCAASTTTSKRGETPANGDKDKKDDKPNGDPVKPPRDPRER